MQSVNPVVSLHSKLFLSRYQNSFLCDVLLHWLFGATKINRAGKVWGSTFLTWSNYLKVGQRKDWTRLFPEVQQDRGSGNGCKLAYRIFRLDISKKNFHKKDSQNTGAGAHRGCGLYPQQNWNSIWTRLCTTWFNWRCFARGLPYVTPEVSPSLNYSATLWSAQRLREVGRRHRQIYKLLIFTICQSQPRPSWIPKFPTLIASTEVCIHAWEPHQPLGGGLGKSIPSPRLGAWEGWEVFKHLLYTCALPHALWSIVWDVFPVWCWGLFGWKVLRLVSQSQIVLSGLLQPLWGLTRLV